jgi:hypothetical protein
LDQNLHDLRKNEVPIESNKSIIADASIKNHFVEENKRLTQDSSVHQDIRTVQHHANITTLTPNPAAMSTSRIVQRSNLAGKFGT